MSRQGGQRKGAAERYLPLAYFLMAILLVVVAMPSVLRQIPPEQNQTAELSPDAPPDDAQQSIISSLNRASSGTAGTGEGTGTEGEVAVELPPPPPRPLRACPGGVGNPPRQTFSIYAPPCAGAFTGDNGGATTKGVTATEIRIATHTGGASVGWADASAGPGESAKDRTWRVLQQWLNARYQLYGRTIRLYKYDPGANDAAANAATAAELDQLGVFAVAGQGPILGRELARRKIVYFGEVVDQWDDSFTEAHRPYVWTWHASATRMRQHAAEYICGRLANRPAKFAGSTYALQARTFGVVYDDIEGKHGGPELQRLVKERCGIVIPNEAMVGFTSATDAAALSTAVARLQASNVTTVVAELNWLSMISLTNAAQAQGYSPEWLINGNGLNDVNVQGRLMDQSQWNGHAFGFSAMEIEAPQWIVNPSRSDEYRAYKELDPGGEPDGGPDIFWSGIQQMANGIQMAGPRLTPETFEAGLFSVPLREGPPNWAASGGYRPGNRGYATAVGEIWWDSSAVDSDGTSGAYRWTRDGTRWKVGQLPPGETTVFTEGTPTRPADWMTSY